jgi:beta-galactosidase
VRAGVKLYDWASWGEHLSPLAGTTALAWYADQFYSGKVAAVNRKAGKGSVTYIGVESLAGELEKDLLQRVYANAGVAVRNFDSQFLVDWRDGFWTATNFSSKRQTAPIPPGAKIIVGSRDLAPAGVTIWIEQ